MSWCKGSLGKTATDDDILLDCQSDRAQGLVVFYIFIFPIRGRIDHCYITCKIHAMPCLALSCGGCEERHTWVQEGGQPLLSFQFSPNAIDGYSSAMVGGEGLKPTCIQNIRMGMCLHACLLKHACGERKDMPS